MDPDLSRLDEYLHDNGLDGYLISADGDDSDQRYLSGFSAPDPFTTLYTGETHLLVSSLEYGRAKRESRADTIERHADYDYQEKLEEYDKAEAGRRVLAEFLAEHDAEEVGVPDDFPLGIADGLREQGVEIVVDEDDGVVEHIRATKTDEELDNVRAAQTANEEAMATAERMLREAEVRDGTLYRDDEPLTSERVKEEIEVSLIRNGCALDTTIVACGSDAADPHDRGSGPLRADQSIIIDIFPRSKETGYHADMTRTFVRGEPSDTVREWHDLTLEAQEAALDAIEAGVSGSEVHGAVCDVYEDAGWPTLRSDPDTETGFIHTTGHGVGLDVHEYPRVSPQDNELEAGQVVTVEPGLYDPDVGGVRVEDLVVVTEDGHENLTDYEKSLVL